MIDLHVHILPDLDDGARDMDESLEMAEIALESGVDTIVATPHSNQEGRFENYCSAELTQVYQEFRSRIKEERLPITILHGMEIFASEEIGERVSAGMLMGLNHSKYYLMEFPFEADPWWMGERVEDLLAVGKIPLIAHPERYEAVQDYPTLVYEWLRMGCLTQVNKGSLFGKFGRRPQQAVEILLQNDLVTCVASDAHSPYMRTTYMGDAEGYLEEVFGDRKAYLLLTKNPETIIRNGRISPHGRMPEKRRWYYW